MRRPLNSSEVSQGFGENPQLYAQFGLAGHHGTDYVASVGTPIYAVENGVVEKSGNGITDKYTGGFFAGETTTIIGQYETLYGHQSQRLVSPGQRVTEGQLIGYTGNTGYTTGPHLHFGIRPLQPNLNNGYRGYIDFASVLFATPAPVEPALQPYQRKVQNSTGVNGRAEPNTTSAIVKEYAQGEILDFAGWIKGQNVNGIDTWYVGKYSETFWWAGAFEDKSTNGLPEIIKEVTPVTPPPVVTPPVTPQPVDNPDIIDITASDIPTWIRYDEVADPDDKATTNQEAKDYYKVAYKPIELHAHWWGSPNAGSTHDGTVSHLKNTTDLSVNFVLSENRITKMVKLTTLAYTTGQRNPYGWKIETDPKLTEGVYKTLGALTYIVEKKNPRLANEPIRLHKEFMSTACSEIDVAKVRAYANKFVSGELDINTGNTKETPVVVPPVVTPTTPPVVPPTEALSSAARFVARVATQFAAAQVIVKGLCELAKQYDLCNLTSKQEGIAVIVATVLIIFGAQVAYKMNKSWKWIF